MTNCALKMSRPGLRALKIAITLNLTVREGGRIDAPTNEAGDYYERVTEIITEIQQILQSKYHKHLLSI